MTPLTYRLPDDARPRPGIVGYRRSAARRGRGRCFPMPATIRRWHRRRSPTCCSGQGSPAGTGPWPWWVTATSWSAPCGLVSMAGNILRWFARTPPPRPAGSPMSFRGKEASAQGWGGSSMNRPPRFGPRRIGAPRRSRHSSARRHWIIFSTSIFQPTIRRAPSSRRCSLRWSGWPRCGERSGSRRTSRSGTARERSPRHMYPAPSRWRMQSASSGYAPVPPTSSPPVTMRWPLSPPTATPATTCSPVARVGRSCRSSIRRT